jgi:hypothetical protein
LTIAGLAIVATATIPVAMLTLSGNLREPTADSATTTVVSTPTTVPTMPSYIAADYNAPGGHPSLTPDQTATIRRVLARVKPCQRPLVRYVLTQGEKDGIALFFEPEPDQWAHILGEPDAYYAPLQGVFAGPPDDPNTPAQGKQGMQWDIDRQPCPKR